MKNSKRILSLVLSAGLLLTGCGSTDVQEEVTSSAVLVDVAEAKTGELTLSNQFVGVISPQESVYVVPLAQGTVKKTFFEVGDDVEEGDILFEIDDSGAKLQLQQAKLTYNNTKQQADSALTTQQTSANLQLDSGIAQAEAGYIGAQAKWKTAKDAYDDLCDQYSAAKKALKQAQDAGADEATIAELKKAKNTLGEARDQAEVGANAAEAAMEAAEVAYQNAKESAALTQGEVLENTKKQLDNGLALAKVGVDAAELSLSYYSVKTPISGKVIAKNVEVNGMATSASPAYTIAAQDTMTVTFQVSEAIKNTLSKDQKLVVERSGKEYEGVITEIANSVGMSTGLFQIKALVKANGDELPSGVSVKVTSDTYKAENDVIIPYNAVYFENAGAYVYVEENGVAVKKYVTVGIFNEDEIQVVEGIAPGDHVITSWSPRLMDGVAIEAKGKEAAE